MLSTTVKPNTAGFLAFLSGCGPAVWDPLLLPALTQICRLVKDVTSPGAFAAHKIGGIFFEEPTLL
jgi:hypothetical protein